MFEKIKQEYLEIVTQYVHTKCSYFDKHLSVAPDRHYISGIDYLVNDIKQFSNSLGYYNIKFFLCKVYVFSVDRITNKEHSICVQTKPYPFFFDSIETIVEHLFKRNSSVQNNSGVPKVAALKHKNMYSSLEDLLNT